MLKTIIAAVITSVVISLVVVGLVGGSAAQVFGSQVQNDVFWFTGGIKLGNSGATSFDASGNLATGGTLTIGSGGTALSNYKCFTASWNPAAVGSSTAATLDIATPGVTLGDSENASIATSTQGLAVTASASTTATSTITLFDSDNTGVALDIATTTAKICYFH